MINVYPGGGLANRMRVIDSCVALGEDLGIKLKVIWNSNSELNCPFYSLFKSTDHFEVVGLNYFKFYAYPNYLLKKASLFKKFSKWQRTVFFDKTINNKDILDFIQKEQPSLGILSEKNIFIESCERFRHSGRMKELFQPVPFIEDMVLKVTEKFSSNTVGIHIRRTDHSDSIKLSKTAFFVEAMENEISKNSNTTFFLASDSKQVTTHLIRHFGERVIKRNVTLARNTEDGIKDAVVDFFCLAATKKIFGSANSSFSKEAAEISNIDLSVIDANFLSVSQKTDKI